LLEKTFFNKFTHMIMAHHKARTEPACSRACFCLGLFSIFGNTLDNTSQIHFHSLEGKASVCFDVLFEFHENADASITHTAVGVTYSAVDFQDGASILYKFGFVHEIN
jgi:hypothetical protein